MLKFVVALSFLVAVPLHVRGHGMLMDPVNRASRWRYDPTAPQDFDDNQLFCGGFAQQWISNEGKCGLCGDNYVDPTPRAHEYDGEFGHVIVKSYQQGSIVPVQARITANHLGFFKFRLCNLDKFKTESEECFEDINILMPNGDDKFVIESYLGDHNLSIKLPAGLTCEHCILQWTYVAGNTWGTCEDGTTAKGCGPQEHFRTCSDVTITS